MAEHGELLMKLHGVGVSYKPRGGLLRRRGEAFWALEDISLSLFRGESLGIIGRNGVGKSTLLRLLAGIIDPDRGRIESNGCTAALLSLQVGFEPHLTGRDNAILSGMLLGLSRRRMLELMPAIIDFSELGSFIDEPTYSYSDGMRARLGFSVAMQMDPDVLLIDEVLGAGDADFREKSSEAMKERIKSEKTVVLVSHSAGTIRSLCDRAVWIENGCTREEGIPHQVLASYDAFLQELKKRKHQVRG
jgi:lipopolysaccharide transport system ATP-binding protein